MPGLAMMLGAHRLIPLSAYVQPNNTCPAHLVAALQMTAQEARTELLKSKAAMGGDASTNGNRHEIGDGLAGWQSA